MTAEHDEQLERALTELTTWHGRVPQLWRRALATAKAGRSRSAPRLAWLIHSRVSGAIAASIIIVALGITVALSLPSLSSMRYSANLRSAGAAELSAILPRIVGHDAAATYTPSAGPRGDRLQGRRAFIPDQSAGYIEGRYSQVVPRAGASEDDKRRVVGTPSRGLLAKASQQGLAVEPRHIVRKATIEFVTDDVRAAFLKAALIISEADGEYIQDSSLTGSAENMQANLTLRVAARRLPEVMNALRELGEVRSEQVAGQDVTTQVVDVEARLRNEQRVEAELLELLEKRKDAPLKEILELRSTLGQVRGGIERFTAQRERLNRLVSLATVLVIIRTDKSASGWSSFSIVDYFGDGVRKAWQKGLMLLADTCGFLLSVLVGGLIWWILLVVVIGAIWRYRRRAADSTTRS